MCDRARVRVRVRVQVQVQVRVRVRVRVRVQEPALVTVRMEARGQIDFHVRLCSWRLSLRDGFTCLCRAPQTLARCSPDYTSGTPIYQRVSRCAHQRSHPPPCRHRVSSAV